VSLLVVLDGRDYRTRAKLPIIVDNLIAQKRIRPIALALVQHGGQARFIEYMCNDATLGFLLREVLPLAQAQLNLLDIQKQPGAYGILGASMGGLIALYTGLRAPQIFGQVLSQSGAFGFGLPNMDSVIFDLIRLMPAPPIRVWLDVGRYEFLFQANQRMRDLLTERNYRFDYREYNGGHNYTAWRDDVAHGLVALFGR
jgi:enterochelin esterase family protein